MADQRDDALEPAGGSSVCEWKGLAGYFDVVGGGRRAEIPAGRPLIATNQARRPERCPR